MKTDTPGLRFLDSLARFCLTSVAVGAVVYIGWLFGFFLRCEPDTLHYINKVVPLSQAAYDSVGWLFPGAGR